MSDVPEQLPDPEVSGDAAPAATTGAKAAAKPAAKSAAKSAPRAAAKPAPKSAATPAAKSATASKTARAKSTGTRTTARTSAAKAVASAPAEADESTAAAAPVPKATTRTPRTKVPRLVAASEAVETTTPAPAGEAARAAPAPASSAKGTRTASAKAKRTEATAAASEAAAAEAPPAEAPLAEAPVAEAPPVPAEPPVTEVPEAPATVAPAAGPSGNPLTPPIEVQAAPTSPKPRPRKANARPAAPQRELGEVMLSIQGLSKHFGQTVAVDSLDLEVRQGSFYGIVGPNGAGKTTTLSMITGLLRPSAGRVTVHGIDVWADPVRAKRTIGVLPDALRLFDRLTGAQLLYYAGTLRGLDHETVRQRSQDLVAAFGIEDAVDRLVADYSAGMTKKIALACAMIHSPRLLVLDEPFESVDPVSAANLNEILQKYVAAGGTVVLSSHGMDFIQRVCDHVAIIVAGRVLSAGTMDEVRGSKTLEERFVELAGGRKAAEGMEWLHSFTD